MLVVRGLCVSFGDRELLSDVSFEIEKGERVALLGENGCGKSTLLRVLSGELEPSAGLVRFEDLRRVHYIEQAPPRAEDALSSGQRMRRRIKAALDRRPDLLLLDEPTNHLDAEGLAWLEQALRAYEGAILFACHDRAFVDAVAERTFLIARGHLRAFDGGYARYHVQVSAETAAQKHAHESWRKERDRLHLAAARQRNWAEKAHRDAGERNPGAKRRAAQLMHKAMATEGRLGRLEAARVEKPWQEPALSFSFLPPRDLPPTLLRLQDVAFTYRGASTAAIGPLTLGLGRGERLALVGPNGSGKSTLLALIAAAGGEGPPPPGRLGGSLALNPRVRLFFLQQEEPLADNLTALDAMLTAGAPDMSIARTLLGHFHIQGETALQTVSRLSPGERVRLQFCRCLVRGADILLLDEPTNHLDLVGREALQSALAVYPGSVLFASHDRLFREGVATRSLEIRPTPDAEAPDEPDLLRMRMAELTARLASARPAERKKLEDELDSLVARLRREAAARRPG